MIWTASGWRWDPRWPRRSPPYREIAHEILLRLESKFGLEPYHSAAILTVMQNRRPEHPSPAPNYTGAFLTSFGVIVFMALFAVWAIWGLIVAAIISWIADRLMTIDFRTRN
jgi:hypothetical protein